MKVEGSVVKSYIGQVHEAILNHPNWFRRNRVVLAGDFNSNKIWDGKRELTNHSIVVELLKKRGITSTYHAFYSERQGEETRPTYFQYRDEDLGYHIDYVFVRNTGPQQYAASRLGNIPSGQS